eukprot:3887074-Prymnesium_polylepis.1
MMKPQSVCSSTTSGACESLAVLGTGMQGLRCRCPMPYELINPSITDANLAPYLPAGGCVECATCVARVGMLLPMFGTAASGYASLASLSPRVGAYQAFSDINNKTDGVADDLLPNTRLEFAYHDSKCDANEGLNGALALTRDAFTEGIDAIVGAGCSGASVPAARVAGIEKIPI